MASAISALTDAPLAMMVCHAIFALKDISLKITHVKVVYLAVQNVRIRVNAKSARMVIIWETLKVKYVVHVLKAALLVQTLITAPHAH